MDSLQHVIAQIYLVDCISMAERRRLAARVAVATLQLGKVATTIPTVDFIVETVCDGPCEYRGHIDQMQHVLDEIAAVTHIPKIGISAAKKLLRARDPTLASRLGRLSKLRNSVAHPDRTLASDAVAALSPVGSSSSVTSSIAVPLEPDVAAVAAVDKATVRELSAAFERALLTYKNVQRSVVDAPADHRHHIGDPEPAFDDIAVSASDVAETVALVAELDQHDVDSVSFAPKAMVDDDAPSLFEKRPFFERPLVEMRCPPPRR